MIRPGELLTFKGGCSVLTSMDPVEGQHYSYRIIPRAVLVLATEIRRVPTDTRVFALCLMQGHGMCWIGQSALHFLPETV